MELMDYLYNDEIIMRNHDAQLMRESEARGISIGCNETLNKLLSQSIITKEQAAQFQA